MTRWMDKILPEQNDILCQEDRQSKRTIYLVGVTKRLEKKENDKGVVYNVYYKTKMFRLSAVQSNEI